MPTVLRGAAAATIAAALLANWFTWLERPDFTPFRYLSYFTTLSNIAACALLTAEVTRTGAPPGATARGAVTLSLAVVAYTDAILLGGAGGTPRWIDVVLHVIAPVVMLLDWYGDPPGEPIRRRTVATWLAVPVLYVAVVLVAGAVSGWYPYRFLDPADGLGGPAVWIGVIGMLFVACAVLLQRTTNRRTAATPIIRSGVRPPRNVH